MRLLTPALALLIAFPAVAAETVPALLERQTNELLAGITAGNTEAWKRHADERLIYVTAGNEVLTRAQLMEQIKPLPKGLVGKLKTADFKAVVYGDVAVATYIADEWLDYYGQIIENDFRTTDTWVKTKDGWKLIATQVLAVLFDPPSVALPQETLCAYNGTYRLTPEITTKIACTEDALSSERTGRPAATFKAEVRDVFFQPGQPRTRRVFLRDEKGAITAFVDRREGLDVRWTKVQP